MTESPGSEDLYDAYLDALLADEDCTPEAFLGGREVERSVRERMRAVHEAARPGSAPATPGEAPAELREGRRLGDYLLRERLGDGGMGVVFAAEQLSLGRRVALKLLRPELAGSASAQARFEREARAVARLRHPHVVQCFAFEEVDGHRVLVMELAEGRGLDEILRDHRDRGGVELARALRWIADVADGLHAAHQQGLVHRDVKPANIRIGSDDRALLLDFGVARDLETDQATLTRSFLGTPSYMAPEQIARKGGEVDGRTDVYSLGVSLYECVTRAAPFRGETVEALFHQILEREAPPPRSVRPSLSRDLETVILRAMAKEPRQRYPDAAAFRDDLQALLDFRPIAARRPGPWRRARGAARRHPLRFAGVAAALLSAALIGAIGIVQELTQRHQRLERRDSALDAVRRAVQAHGEEFAGAREREQQVLRLLRRRSADYMTDDEHRALDQRIEEVSLTKARREQAYYEILEQLRRAEALGADALELRELRGRLYLARLDELRTEGELELVEVYRDLVLEHDPRGRLRQELGGATPIRIEVDVEGAELHLFRLVDAARLEPGAPRRRVAAPLEGGALPFPPTTTCLEVLESKGELLRGDLLLELEGQPVEDGILVTRGEGELLEFDRLLSIDGEPVRGWYEVAALGLEQSHLPRVEPPRERRFVFASADGSIEVRARSLEELGVEVGTAVDVARRGGARATVWRAGRRLHCELPAGLATQALAAPFLAGEATRVGRSPLPPLSLPGGSYGVLAFSEDRGSVRSVVQMPQQAAAGLRLSLRGDGPEGGFALVPSWWSGTDERREFWMQRTETTFGEYLRFLSDATVRARLEASATPILVPRSGPGPADRFVLEAEDGAFRLAEGWPSDLPVFGVSWHDAVAYAQWRTERAREQGRPWRFSLPTHDQWCRAAACATEYPFGERFHPRWVASAYSRRRPFPFRVNSFPVDVSWRGVADLSGNLSEWLEDWWLEDRGLRRHGGGSWAIGGPESVFGIQGGNGSPMDAVSATIGFRLVAERIEETR